MSHPVHLILSPGTRTGHRGRGHSRKQLLILSMGFLGLFTSLFGTSCSKNTIRNEFINARDGTVIAVSDLAPEQLPDSFAIETTLDMGGKKWSVERAEPQDKRDILKAGKVRIYLTPLTTMPPQDILYSLPTISDDMGAAAGDTLPSPEVMALHEDDWRQVEFVAQKYAAEIEADFADIRRIYQEQRSGVGFKSLHVRKRIPHPLAGSQLSLRELEAMLAPPRKYAALGFHRTRGTIPNGFAWEIDQRCVVWGVTDPNGTVIRLCLLGNPDTAIAAFSERLADLNSRYQLTFVDWCRATSITTNAEAFRKHFTREK